MFKSKRSKKKSLSVAQTFVEYTILLGVVIMIMLAMSPMLKRGSQGLVKTVADQIGNQQGADQAAEYGYLKEMHTISASEQTKSRTEYLGAITTGISEQVRTTTQQVSNQGFSEQ